MVAKEDLCDMVVDTIDSMVRSLGNVWLVCRILDIEYSVNWAKLFCCLGSKAVP